MQTFQPEHKHGVNDSHPVFPRKGNTGIGGLAAPVKQQQEEVADREIRVKFTPLGNPVAPLIS